MVDRHRAEQPQQRRQQQNRQKRIDHEVKLQEFKGQQRLHERANRIHHAWPPFVSSSTTAAARAISSSGVSALRPIQRHLYQNAVYLVVLVQHADQIQQLFFRCVFVQLVLECVKAHFLAGSLLVVPVLSLLSVNKNPHPCTIKNIAL